MRSGFSLVELSIVLVILGLLTGGILAGQSLIRASELRAVSTEYSRYSTAVQAFRDKYFSVPGDFRDATKFWGLQVSGSNCISNSSVVVGTPGACDGNGDGVLLWDNSGAISTAREMHQFWRQLANAGLIEGTYTGLAGPNTNSADTQPGTNSPRSKLSNAGWGAGQAACGAGAQCYTNLYGVNAYPSYLIFGVPNTTGVSPKESAIKPEEAWNIDTKMDDGRPATGNIVAVWRAANTCTTSATAADAAGSYNLINSSTQCALFFLKAF